jgi:hypothetical protein
MNPGQRPVIAQIVQILADGLRRDLETPGKIFHHHPAKGAGDIENLGLAVSKAGHIRTSGKKHPMVRPFRHPVNAADRPQSRSAAERQILVKAACAGNQPRPSSEKRHKQARARPQTVTLLSRDLSPEETMSRRLLIIASMLVFSICAAPAQTPSPDAMTAARSLVTTMKLSDQYKALLPGILLGLRPVLTQDRPEIERDYDAMMPTIVDAFAPYYNAMVDNIATVYASTFTAGELREIEAFYRQPVGQKLLQKSAALAQQSNQVGQDSSRKAADELRARLTEALRQKGHKL